MVGTVFLKSMHDQRRGLIGWAVGLALLVVLIGSNWPSMKEITGLDELIASYPEGLKAIFSIDDLGSGTGYLNAELFSMMVPALFLIFAIGRGARLVAGEEEAGTLEVVLVTPVSAIRFLLHQAASLAVSVLALGGVLFGSMVATSTLFGLGVSTWELFAASVSMVLLGLEFGMLALAVGAIFGIRWIAVTVASIVAVLSYVLYIVAAFQPSLVDWQRISPIYQAIHDGPLGAGVQSSYVWMPIAAVVFLLVAAPLFNRRDIAAR